MPLRGARTSPKLRTWHFEVPARQHRCHGCSTGHLNAAACLHLLALVLLAGEQAQLEMALINVLLGHAAAPLA